MLPTLTASQVQGVLVSSMEEETAGSHRGRSIAALPGLLGDLWQMASNREEQTQLHTAADPSAPTFMLCGRRMDRWVDEWHACSFVSNSLRPTGL